MDIKERVKKLPSSAGVYLMKDESGAVIYVGKAADLRKRVSSYFRPRARLDGRISAMVSRVSDIDFIGTSSESEALIYENGLIKKLMPKYNVALKDGKSYPMLKVTINERFPRLLITRKDKGDGALYYGPYSDAKLLRHAVDGLRQIFPLRKCDKMGKRVCLDYHIKQCAGPCEGRIGEPLYAGMVDELRLYLEGKRKELFRLLYEKMSAAARIEDFEEASRIRSRLEALSLIKEKKISYGSAAELDELRAVLGMDRSPERIEAFDISNISGRFAVGSMVYFYRGRPKKSCYRKFRIKTVSGPDDYAMLREVISRRYSRLLAEKVKSLPDLVIIDGGKGQVSAAAKVLDDLGLAQIPVIGIAKQFEHIYQKNRPDPIILPRESKALHIVERIRDQAHKFAISYHKHLMSKSAKASELDEVPGIGRARKDALVRYFGDIEKIKSATLQQLLAVRGMNEKTARGIIGYFKR